VNDAETDRAPEDDSPDRQVLASVLEIASATAGAEDLDTVLATLAHNLGRLFPIDAAALALVEEGGLAVREVVIEAATARRDPGYPVDDGSHLMSWIIKEGRPLWRNDAATEVRFAATPGLAPMKSDMVIPLRARGRIIGAFRVACRRRHAFDPEDFELLQRCADLTAVAVENQRLLQTTRRLAETDGVTGVFNHRYGIALLREVLERAAQGERPAAILMADIDHFKRFNDTYGHQVGDEVLRLVAQTLVRGLRRSDVVARYGGEEFVAILPDTDRAAALALAERVREAVATGAPPAGGLPRGLRVTISVGVAGFPADAVTPVELLVAADQALYHAKHAGRDRVCAAGASPADATGRDDARS
jgi:diguanylate cyclase (GGDEF)-like protein